MRPSILLLAFVAVTITSCTSAYKSGQTPDDVYFSPQRPQTEYVAARERDDDPGYSNNEDYYGDRYLQMKVRNRYQWSALDDYYYNDRYSYGFGGGYGYSNSLYAYNPWSPVSYWNYFYNPYYSSFYNPYYYSPVYFVGTKYPNYYNNNSYSVSNRPRTFNLNTYNNNQLNNSNYTNRRFDYNNQNNNVNGRYNNNYRNSRTSAGDYLRNSFGGNNNNSSNNSNYNNNNSGGSRSSGSSSSGGSSSSSSSGSSAPVRKF